jgi:hypothetical protein
VVECTLAVRDGLLAALPVADGFNGLDVGFLPDERSAKEQCIVEMWCVYTTIGGGLGTRHAERLYSNSAPKPVFSLVAACGASAFIYILSTGRSI